MTNSGKSLYCIFQYFEFEFLFTFENDKQREAIVLNERDHVIIFLQRNDTILLQIAVAFNKLIKHGISQVAQDYHRNTKKPGNCHLNPSPLKTGTLKYDVNVARDHIKSNVLVFLIIIAMRDTTCKSTATPIASFRRKIHVKICFISVAFVIYRVTPATSFHVLNNLYSQDLFVQQTSL